MPNLETISLKSPLLERAKILGNRNSKTLGFLPDGAYDEYAKKGWIFGATDTSHKLLGYILFRVAKERASIVHLCCDESTRSQGTGTYLLNRLRIFAEKQELLGLSLYCRREYDANLLWKKFGFIPIREKVGRGKDRAPLTHWWYELPREDLFTRYPDSDDRMSVAIDCNVFRDLHDHSQPRNAESLPLAADWLAPHLEMVVTKELFNELHRIVFDELRVALRDKANGYRRIDGESKGTHVFRKELEQIFSASSTPHKLQSDIEHLAICISGNVDVFVTRDAFIHSKGDEIENRWGLQVKRPVELIVSLDRAESATRYQPQRLFGSEIDIYRPNEKEVDELARAFHEPAQREGIRHLRAVLRSELADTTGRTVLVSRMRGNPIFLLVREQSERTSTLTLIRASDGPLALTALRHSILNMLRDISESGGGLLRISDKALTESIFRMLLEVGLRPHGTSLEKRVLRFIGTVEKALEIGLLKKGLDNAEPDRLQALDVETKYWPAKVFEAGIPSWTVPIRSHWAAALFDSKISNEHLWASKADLILNRENVYYSRAKNAGLWAPGRIIWYVTGDRNDSNRKSYRACSRLIEVAHGSARDLFRKFRRIGVYTWDDILKLTSGNHDQMIVAYRFTDTELFQVPISFEEGKAYGIRHTNAGPLPLDEKIFEKIYRRGTGLADSG